MTPTIHNERPRLDIGIDDPGGGAEPADEPAITAGDPDSGSERAKKESRRLLDKTVDSSDEPTSISAERPRLDVALPGRPSELDQPDSISNERDDDSIDAGEYPPAEMADIAPVIDMWYVLTFWGTDEPNADLDGDGVVDVIDLLLALAEDHDPHFDVRYLLWYLAQRADDFAPEERNDYNGPDIFIPMSDLLWRIIEMWGTNDRVADINNDGIVDMFDFIEAMQMLRLPPYAINALLDFLSDLVDGPIAMPGVMDTLTMEPDRPDHNLYPDATPPDEDTDLGPVESCPSDCANDDGVVDASDLLRLLSEWGTPGPHACDVVGDRFDAHGDGVVDVDDILSLLAAWGKCS